MSKKKERIAPESVDDLALVTWDPKTNRVYCTSLDVAEHYGFRHNYVVGKIERHIQEDNQDAGDLQQSLHISHHDFDLFEGRDGQNRPLQMYAMTREGFMDIAQNFTGEDARRWKRKFRKAFSHYEKIALARVAHDHDPDRIAARLEGIEVRKRLASTMVDLRDAIEEVQREGSQCAKRTLSNLTRLAQMRLFNRTIPKDAKLRDWLVRPQLDDLKAVESMMDRLLAPLVEKVRSGEMDYHEPYNLAKDRVGTMVMLLGGPTEVPDFIKGMEPRTPMPAPALPKRTAHQERKAA